jgi:hypothetical protein
VEEANAQKETRHKHKRSKHRKKREINTKKQTHKETRNKHKRSKHTKKREINTKRRTFVKTYTKNKFLFPPRQLFSCRPQICQGTAQNGAEVTDPFQLSSLCVRSIEIYKPEGECPVKKCTISPCNARQVQSRCMYLWVPADRLGCLLLKIFIFFVIMEVV